MFHRHPRRAIAAALGATVLAGLLVAPISPVRLTGVPFTSRPGSSAPALAVPPTASPVTGLKPALSGLLDRKGEPKAAYDAVLGGWVINIHWSDVQKRPGATLDFSQIDRAIAAVRALNRQHGYHLGLKLRFFAGVWSPDWAKNLGGGPITIVDPQNKRTYTTPRFWTADFQAAYDNAIGQLAARYDNTPELREVVVSRCTSVYAEPMIKQASIAANRTALLRADPRFTADDEACQRQQIVEMEVWHHTRVDVTLNPYQTISGTPAHNRAAIDENFTVSIMDFCRATLGAQCVLENNSLSDPYKKGAYGSMYQSMQARAPGIAFQTDTMSRIHDFTGTLGEAVTLGASSVELPSGYTKYTPAQLHQYAVRLDANAGVRH